MRHLKESESKETKWQKDLHLNKICYSKEPKTVTSFNQLTFFPADINQSEVEDSFQLVSDWIKSVQKNVNKSKAVRLLGSLL